MVYLRVIVQKIHYRFQNGGGSFGHWKAEGSGIKAGDAQVTFTVLQDQESCETYQLARSCAVAR